MILTKDYIIIAGILMTFLATIIGHYYTRRNIKTSKFIEVVTTERIKWLSIIRMEIAEVVSLITDTLIWYHIKIEKIESQNPSDRIKNYENYKHQKHYFDALTKDAFKPNQLPDFRKMIAKLYLLKLRFNPNEDKETLELFDFFINFYNSNYKNQDDIELAYEKLICLINNIQKILKNEWEKAKSESKGK